MKSSADRGMVILFLAGIVACGYGWLNNLYQIWQFTGVVSGEILMRTIGVFAWPIGIVLGYF